MHRQKQDCATPAAWTWFGIASCILILALYAVARMNYLVFHTSVEGFSIMVAGLIFSVGIASRQHTQGDGMLLLGVGYLCVGAFDWLHTLTFQGMGVIPGYGMNTSNQLWVVARGLEATMLCILAFVPTADGVATRAMYALAAFVALMFWSIMGLRNFPDCFIPGTGVPPFKTGFEYVVAALFVAAAMRIRGHGTFGSSEPWVVWTALLLKALAEISLAVYIVPTGLAHFAGHILKAASYMLLYRSLVKNGIQRPYEDLVEANSLIAAQVRAKDELIATCSHELRTPLTILLANLQLLSSHFDQVAPDRREALLARGVVQTRKLNGLITELMDYTRLSDGKLALSLHSVDLSAHLPALVQQLSVAYPAHNVVYVDMATPDELPTVVNADGERLERAVSNLMSNAAKYSAPSTTITVTLAQANGQAEIGVTDEGQGIPEDDLPLIFDKYYRAGSVKTEAPSGIGLGLFITREIVRLHGGELLVRSAAGEGSTFSILLPFIA